MPKKKEQDLTSALEQLEQIVEDLNTQNIDIESGLKKFKEGAALIKLCKTKLQKAENEFTNLKEDLEKDLED